MTSDHPISDWDLTAEDERLRAAQQEEGWRESLERAVQVVARIVTFCLIPAKPYAQAKSRLAPALAEAEREALSRRLLARTLRLALNAFERVIVVSRDPALLSDAETQGALGLPERSTGLNLALTQAARFAQGHGAGGLLVLPADLPHLTAANLHAILALRAVSPAVVIAPCRHGTGTNVLLLRPPDLIPFAFGPHSFAAHCNAARAAGVEPAIYRAPEVAFDLDTPEDWQLYTASRKQEIGD